jgi:uncharacterized protein (DUF342 family)
MGVKGITAEVDIELVKKILVEGSQQGTVVARGIPPTPPVEGKLEYLVDTDSINHQPVEDEAGRVDYKNLKMFMSVVEGQPLVRRHDPEPGAPGTDVFGKLIPIQNLPPVRLPVGAGIKIVENGYVGVAALDGALTQVDNHLAVMAVFMVPQDVSYKSGNIDFNGNVDVGRDLLSGFSIKAEGDVIVRGVVEAATIQAKGDIIIFGGIQGAGKARLYAGGKIEARFVNDATLVANGDVIIRTSITNSEIQTQESLIVTSGRGTLTGGHVRARKGVECPNIGSKMGVVTNVQIGLEDDILDRIAAAEEIVASTTRLGMQNKNRIQELAQMREELRLLQQAEIKVAGTLYPGVILRYPGGEYKSTDALSHLVFFNEKWKILTRPLGHH